MTKKQIITNVLLTLLLLALGIGLIAGGAVLKKSTDEKIAAWVQIEGIVVGAVDAGKNDDNQTMYREVIRYEAADGNFYEITSSSSSNIYPKIGKKRTVAYNPENPKQAIIVSDSKLGNTLMLVVGGVFTAVGALLIVSVVLKSRKKNAPGLVPEEASEPLPEPEQNEQPASSGRYVFTGSTPPAPNQPASDNPFEEFDNKDR